MTLKELLDFEFTANEDGEVIALVPLSRVNNIAYILTNQKEKIDKANEILNKGCFEYDNCPDSIINEIIELKQILGDKE